MKSLADKFKILAAVFLVLSIMFSIFAFYKLLVYENSDYHTEDNKNAYVNGDAYNYIINGTYFAGFASLSGACLICSCATYSLGEYAELKSAYQGTEEDNEGLPSLDE